VTLPSSRAPLPARTQRIRSVTNNGKAFPQHCPASVRPFVTSSDVCLPISSSQSRTCKTKHTTSSSDMFFIIYTLSFTITTCACRMTTHDCTLIRIPDVSIFCVQKCRTNADRYGRRCSSKRRTGNVAWEDSGLKMRGDGRYGGGPI